MSEHTNTRLVIQSSDDDSSNHKNLTIMDSKEIAGDKCAADLDDKSSAEPTITEGQACVCFPGSRDAVFYNPVQEFNRDLR